MRFLALALLAIAATPATAIPIFQASTGSIVHGVAPYGGAPNNGGSTYIPNNFTGLVDILTSPGGGYLTASPIIANNIFESGVQNLGFSFAGASGVNANGVFNYGWAAMTGPLMGYLLTDTNPDGTGRASYTIASMNGTWVENGGFNGQIGAWLSTGGFFGSPVSAGAVSLRVTVQSNALGLIAFPELVLAPRANGPCFGINGITLCNATTFAGFARTAQNVVIPNGEVINVRATLTVIADPDFTMGLIVPSDQLLNAVGPLPEFSFVGMDPSAAIPEPGNWILAAIGLGAVAISRRRNAR
ncbi:MAG: hypothetical protein FJW38_29865 [Acidobacteria bacterium]|nr:hypothetical protein [Acidobacteriota bacterium]